MDRGAIIERIRKLLAMTERAGCTQAEAVQAALMAQRLMAEHDVGSSELHGSDDREPIEGVASEAATRYRDWGKALAAAVAKGFRCKTYEERTGRSRYLQPCFFGRSSDAKAAAIVFDRLYRVGCELGGAERRRARAEKRRLLVSMRWPDRWVKEAANEAAARAYDSFTWGFADGVSNELEKQSVALMITVSREVEERYASIPMTSRNLSTGKAQCDAAYERGEGAGRDAVRAGRVGGGEGRFALRG